MMIICIVFGFALLAQASPASGAIKAASSKLIGLYYEATGSVESTIPIDVYPSDLIDSFHAMVTEVKLDVADSHMNVFGKHLKVDYVAVRNIVDAEFEVMPPRSFYEFFAHGGFEGVLYLSVSD